MAVSVELVHDKESKDDDGCRVIPELLAQESDNEKYFYNSVAQQKESGKMLRTNGKGLRRMKEIIRDQVPGIFHQLVLRQGRHKIEHESLADEIDEKTANNFQ